VKQQLFLHALSEWNHWWQAQKEYRQTKKFFREVDLRRSRIILKQERSDIGLLIRWLTGHNFLRYHRSLLDKTGLTSPMCRFCGTEPETAFHIILHCPAFDKERRLILRIEQPDQDPADIPIASLLRFIKLVGKDLEDPEDPDNPEYGSPHTP